MKKIVLLSLFATSLLITAGCANNGQHKCCLSKWFGGNREQASTVYYPPADCAVCPPPCSTCETCEASAVLEAPIVQGSTCSACAAQAMPGDTVVPQVQPQPQSYK